MLAITLLGTGSPMPDPTRAGPATLIAGDTEQFLVDACRAVLMRLGGAASSAGQLSAVLLTHLHSDHITDLNDVITTRWITTFEPSPLTIVGPIGTRTVVDHILDSLGPDIGYRIAHHGDLNYRPPVEVIEVTGAFFSRHAHRNARGASGLGAEGFIPEKDGEVGLFAEGASKSRGAASLEGRFALVVERLSHDDEFRAAFAGNVRDLRGIEISLDMAEDGKRVRDCARLVTDGDADSFFSGVYGKDSHRRKSGENQRNPKWSKRQIREEGGRNFDFRRRGKRQKVFETCCCGIRCAPLNTRENLHSRNRRKKVLRRADLPRRRAIRLESRRSDGFDRKAAGRGRKTLRQGHFEGAAREVTHIFGLSTGPRTARVQGHTLIEG